ncbi:hypothetical protein CAY35_06040 [Pseudoglutamicibacter cumminsii]|uniref:Uncharacterized protein n=2 Tax=Pseudoglutamicibacter cumminsii TaxID=156979 RepID=A0ABX5L5Y1_9MICC|nr:hypothetical protein CAY35_06040 [Pseudoglutamicibacter cumminsii]
METLTQEQLRLGRLKYSPFDYLASLKEGLSGSEFAEKYRLLKYRCPKGCSLGAVYETPLGRIVTNRGLLYALPLTPQAELIAEYLGEYRRELYTLQEINIKDEEAEGPKVLIASKYPFLRKSYMATAECIETHDKRKKADPFLSSGCVSAHLERQTLNGEIKAKGLHTESAVTWLDDFFISGLWVCRSHRVEIRLTRDDISADLNHARQTKQKTISLKPSYSGRQQGRIDSSHERFMHRDIEENAYIGEYVYGLFGVSGGFEAVKAEALRLAKEKRAGTTETDGA